MFQINSETFAAAVVEYGSIDQYLTEMAKPSTWGDGITIEAAARLYKHPFIILLSHSNKQIEISYSSDSELTPQPQPLCIGYCDNNSNPNLELAMMRSRNHYVSLFKKAQILPVVIGLKENGQVQMPSGCDKSFHTVAETSFFHSSTISTASQPVNVTKAESLSDLQSDEGSTQATSLATDDHDSSISIPARCWLNPTTDIWQRKHKTCP